MSAIIADFFRAWAQSCDRNSHAEQEIIFASVGFPDESAPVVHGRLGATDGSGAVYEVQEINLDVRCFSLQVALQVVQNRRQGSHSDLSLVSAEDFQKAAHVSTFEMVR